MGMPAQAAMTAEMAVRSLLAVDWLGDVFLRTLAQAPGAIGIRRILWKQR